MSSIASSKLTANPPHHLPTRATWFVVEGTHGEHGARTNVGRELDETGHVDLVATVPARGADERPRRRQSAILRFMFSW
jgi:hypothetical protein